MPDIPKFSPALLGRVPEPFDDPDWLYELKYDGFRALVYVRSTGVELRTRKEAHRIELRLFNLTVSGCLAWAVSGHDVATDTSTSRR